MSTTTNSKKKPGSPPVMDEGTRLIIAEGASLFQLSKIFGMDTRTVTAKIVGKVPPCGDRKGHDIFSIKEVAPFLAPPAEMDNSPADVDRLIYEIKKSGKLPPNISKDFWTAMRSRQAYERDQKELLHRSEVTDILAGIFKEFRMSILLMRENVERETGLTERQRDIITEIMDSTLENTHHRIVGAFSGTAESTKGSENDDEL